LRERQSGQQNGRHCHERGFHWQSHFFLCPPCECCMCGNFKLKVIAICGRPGPGCTKEPVCSE
jgi:hypothetical protein